MKKGLCILLILMLMLTFSASAETNVPEAGSVVVYGRYEQDGNPDNGPEPLQWLVLETDENTLLLITQYEIAFQPFSTRQDLLVGWADSELRAWLNNAFPASAFTEEERAAIAETPLHTAGGRRTLYRRGETIEMEVPECDTVDRVFVLSSEETDRYFFFGTNDAYAASEHRLSMPSYSVLIRLALYGSANWENVRDIPGADVYAELANRLLPTARETETAWTMPMPSLREYIDFWHDMPELLQSQELWPSLLREQGMIYTNYWDGLGCTGFYDWYCWDPTCVRPALRVSSTALEQGLITQPKEVFPSRTDPDLIGQWKAEVEDRTEYYWFHENGYRLTMAMSDGDTLYSTSFLCQTTGRKLNLVQLGAQGQLHEGSFRIDGDTLILDFAGQKVFLKRANADEWPQIHE